MVLALCASLFQAPAVTEIRILKGRFVVPSVRLASEGIVRFVNGDREVYTVEAPGLLPGDIMLPPGGTVDVRPLFEAGRFTAMIEEIPTSEVTIDFAGRSAEDPSKREPPFDVARRRDRQPLLFDPGQEPAYGAFATFDLSGRGEAVRQESLQILYRLQEELSLDTPPADFAPYLTPEGWAHLRPSVALLIGLGSTAYDAKRFGPRVAASRPKGLHPFPLAARLKAKLPPGRDFVLRVTSDSHWFNLQVCRLAWRRLGKRIAAPTLESGYAPPRGRSPIVSGFFDGIGNPTGMDREHAVYGERGGNGSYLSFFRIRFDEAAFARLGLAAQEKLVGRQRGSGHIIAKGAPNAHRARAQNDGKSLIVRMPLVFDDGPANTGLLFASAQASLAPVERILGRFMLTKGSPDGLLALMRFERAEFYYLPPSPRGSYPGSLRGF